MIQLPCLNEARLEMYPMIRTNIQWLRIVVGIGLLGVGLFCMDDVHRVYAQDLLDRYSRFYYELDAGEGTDDAVVLINETKESREAELGVLDYSFGKDILESATFDIAQETGTSSMRDWIRFYPSERPIGSQEIELLFGGSYPSRLYPLCEKLKFGSLEKVEREQLVVRALNRTLLPAEIGWLAVVSEWCRGEKSPVVRVNALGSIRIPFVIRLPEDVARSSYRGVIVERSSMGLLPAATIRIRMPGVLPSVLSFEDPVVLRQSGRNQMKVVIRVRNDGGEGVIAKPQLVIDQSGLTTAQSTIALEEREVAAGTTTEFVWFVSRPFLGVIEVTPQVAFYEENIGVLHSSEVLPSVKMVVAPPLWFIVFVICCCCLFVVTIALRVYWEKRWLKSIRSSYVPYSPKSDISLIDLANQFGVLPRILAKVNGVRTTEWFHPLDVVMVPAIPKHTPVEARRGARGRMRLKSH